MFKKRSIKAKVAAKVISRNDSDSDSDSEKEIVTIAKRRKTDNTDSISTKKLDMIYPNGTASLTQNNTATKTNILNQEIIDRERLQKTHGKDEVVDDGLYKGQSNYKQLIPSKSKMDIKGPKKAASNIRSTMVFDFQKDICKDFRDTGFCGYGDSCKFMHSRDDFKAGWKLNSDWKLENQDNLEDIKEIPFKCVLCKGDYKKPVVTNCEHYFCEECYLKRFKKGLSKCFICQKPTNGVVKPAKKLNELLKPTLIS